jgi:LPS-assembly lipoprotein
MIGPRMIGRRSLLAALLAAPGILSGCGWEPLYADRETTAADADLRAIKVNPIPERVGQRLEMALRTSFNPTGEETKQRYSLSVVLTTALASLGVQSQGLGTRGIVQVYANYTLREIGTGGTLTTGSIHSADSFDIQANGYSTVVAQDDALTRSVEELCREIVARLILYLQRKAIPKS